jgi:hypothetical protein
MTAGDVLMMLPTDMALKTDPVFAQHAAAYKLPPQSTPATINPRHSVTASSFLPDTGTLPTSSCSSRTSGQVHPGAPARGVLLTVFSATRFRGSWLPDAPPCATRRGDVLVVVPLFTPYVSHLTRHTSHLTPHTSHLTRHTSHLTPHTSHLTPHTSHLTPHTSHLTPHTPHPAPLRSAAVSPRASRDHASAEFREWAMHGSLEQVASHAKLEPQTANDFSIRCEDLPGKLTCMLSRAAAAGVHCTRRLIGATSS